MKVREDIEKYIICERKVIVVALNQEKSLVGAFSVITNICEDLRFKL